MSGWTKRTFNKNVPPCYFYSIIILSQSCEILLFFIPTHRMLCTSRMHDPPLFRLCVRAPVRTSTVPVRFMRHHRQMDGREEGGGKGRTKNVKESIQE